MDFHDAPHDSTITQAASALGHPRAAQLVIGATQFLVLLDALMVTVALPVIDRELDLITTELPWVFNAYTLALAGGLLVAGRAADLYGRRRLLSLGLLGLTMATVLAAVAPSGPLLIAARAAQGLSAAMAQPASLALVPTLFPHEPQRGRTFAIVGIADSLGGIAGATAGGLVTGLLGWRWVFLVTIPLALAALLLARAIIPESRDEEADRRLDLPAAGLATAGITAVVYAVIQVEQAGPASPAVLTPLLLGVAALLGFIQVERRAPAPLLRLGLLQVPSLIGACVGVATTSVIYSTVVFTGSLYLQRVRGYEPVGAGLTFLPVTLVGGIASIGGAGLIRRLGNRLVAVASLLLGAVTLTLLAIAAATDTPSGLLILPALLVQGVATYGSWVALVGLAACDVSQGERGGASSVFEVSSTSAAPSPSRYWPPRWPPCQPTLRTRPGMPPRTWLAPSWWWSEDSPVPGSCAEGRPEQQTPQRPKAIDPAPRAGAEDTGRRRRCCAPGRGSGLLVAFRAGLGGDPSPPRPPSTWPRRSWRSSVGCCSGRPRPRPAAG
jgi:MFS family permease